MAADETTTTTSTSGIASSDTAVRPHTAEVASFSSSSKEEAEQEATPNEEDPNEIQNNHNKFFVFYTKPRQRQRWGDRQMHPVVNWGDLFFDLFYVAMAYNLSNVIRTSPTAQGLLYFAGAFFNVMYIWWDKMYYDARFYTRDDLWHRLLDISMLLALATAVLHIRPVSVLSHARDNVEMFVLCAALTASTLLTVVRYVEILMGVDGQLPVAKVAARRDLLGKCIPLILQIAAMSVAASEYYGSPHDDESVVAAATTNQEGEYAEAAAAAGTDEAGHRGLGEADASTNGGDYDTYSGHVETATNVPIWLLCGAALGWLGWFAFVIVTLPKNGKHKELTVPMNIDFAIHRYGEWIMLMLGESILSLLIVEISDNFDYYLTFYAGILSVVLLQYMHFRSSPSHADGHAMRRSKEAGFCFACLMQVYSAALVILGVDYKMLLYEYTYEDDNDNKRMLLPDLPRWLAGGGGGGADVLPYDREERQQRIAHFFCGSLAIAFFCCDMLILTHKGLKDNMGRCRCRHSHKLKVIGLFLVTLRAGLIVFVATLSQYVTDPEQLALIGLASIVAELVLRVASSTVFPDDRVHTELEPQEHGHAAMAEDPEEHKWPNVTHAQAEPASDGTEHSHTEHIK